ncbi:MULTISPECIES: CsbD family protein [Methylobacter]
MQLTNMKSTGLLTAVFLTFCSFGAYAEESKIKTNVNEDQVKGRVEEGKGKVKEITGKVLDDKGMEIEGNVQKNLGKAQAGYGDLKKDIKDTKDNK